MNRTLFTAPYSLVYLTFSTRFFFNVRDWLMTVDLKSHFWCYWLYVVPGSSINTIPNCRDQMRCVRGGGVHASVQRRLHFHCRVTLQKKKSYLHKLLHLMMYSASYVKTLLMIDFNKHACTICSSV